MGDPSILQADQWWRQPFGMLQTNLREIDADMGVDEVADFIDQHGANAWLIGIGGIQAQYPTELPFHSKNALVDCRKSGDLIHDAITAAHSKGLRLLARMDFSKVSAEIAAKHPEWCFKSPTGKLQTHDGGLVSVCPSGAYYQERIFDILDEVTRRYPVDGFFINWTTMNEQDYYKRYHGVCQCGNCQTRWLEYSGGPDLPRGPADANYTQWLRFSRDIIDELTGRIRAFISQRLPSACLILGKTADIMFHEANNAVGRELWPHTTTEMVSSWMSYRPDVPVLVNSTCFMDMPYRMASEEPAHFAQYLLQCISRGGYPSTYMMGTPGKIPYLCLDIAGQITRFHKKWSHIYDGLRPVAKTGLVLPDRAQMTAEQFEEAVSEYRGLYSAMQELHVPFDTLAEDRLSAMAENNGLKRHEALILPNLGKLGQKEADALDDWVSEGGNLIATASSAVEDDGTVQLKSLPSERQIDVNRERELLFSTYFAPPQNEAHVHVYTGPIVPLHGAYHSFEWKVDTGGGYKMLARAPFSPPEKAYGNVQMDERGYGTGRYGTGTGVAIPFTIGRGYRELGLGVFRDFFTTILQEEVNPREQISCSIAEQVEMTVNANGLKLVVHLINMSGARKQNFGSHIPISGGKIKVLKGASNISAHALHADKMLDVEDGTIRLPTLDLFEVIVIEGF
ncbi:hypothetical protein FALBO_3658 [Fusarium albosuccineum]|uniref:Beta-galactosidase trimerisation domain-containing protein n=1 Tax=Fusarium albosuccineum TaxID=1237068 RepID=A0A8H4LKR7_9HYPO|nr:hypothetical protein FALBO_3658 [Fusarium albosuccineum]